MIPQTRMPATFTKGTTVKWTQGFSDYPANDGWTAKLWINGATVATAGAGIDGAANAAQFDFTLTTAITDPLVAGDYRWEIRVFKGSEEYVADSGKVVVLASLEGAAAGAARSKAEIELAAVEAEINARLSGDGAAHQEYGVVGRSMVKIPYEQLIARREALRETVWREKNPGRVGPTILTVFTEPGYTN